MLQEKTLIPYHTSSPPKGPWLVFAPHADDESFGMGGTLLLAARNGVIVTLVVLTDGSMGGKESESQKVVSIREKEAREVSKRLHLDSVEFWRQPDRRLKVSRHLIKRVVGLIRKLKPETVFFPSPMELHPDHRTTSVLVWEALGRCPTFNGKAYAYETSVQCLVNRLIDISTVADEKAVLVNLYASQMAERDYLNAVLSLNRARSYTLPPDVRFAEAFFAYEGIVTTDLHLQTLNTLRPYWSEDAVSRAPLVSVIIRTMNRPSMLAKALKSLAEQIYSEIEALVINDGGMDVSQVVETFKGSISKLRYISQEPSQGRSRAANRGLQEAVGEYLMFLDDDDWFYPDHIAKLVDALKKNETRRVAYTGVECLRETPKGQWECIHIFDHYFDPALILICNFIPIHSALFRCELLDGSCRFDENLDIFEDWDFWVQLSQKTEFKHVEGISAAYRIGGKSGFGISGDPLLQRQSQNRFFEKWRYLWSDQQLFKIVDYARREIDFRFMKNELEGKQNQLDSALDRIRTINDHLMETRKVLEEKERTLLSLGTSLRQAQINTKNWMQRVEALETSRIWRYTKPVRILSGIVKIARIRIINACQCFGHILQKIWKSIGIKAR